MQSEEEYDSDEEMYLTGGYAGPNEKIETFRAVLSQWKQQQTDSILGENQDTVILDEYLKKIGKLYINLQQHFELGKPLERNADVDTLSPYLPDSETMDRDTRTQLLHILFRDLVEFPFTYDTQYTNSLKKEEAFNTNILSNK